MPRFKKHLVSIILLVTLTIIAYSNALNNSFVYDDHHHVLENKAIRGLSLKSIVSDFSNKDTLSSSKSLSGNSWRPLSTISYAIDYRLWKLNPYFYHLENIMLHVLNAALVYITAFFIFGNFLTALVAAVIFAIHPIQTEAVTWVSGRSSLLFLLFFLGAIIFHIRNRKIKENSFNYCSSLIFFVCSLLSREMAITLPAMLMLYDYYFLPRKRPKEYIGYYIPFFLIVLFYFLARSSVLGAIAHRQMWAGGNVFTNVSIAIKAVAGYIRLIILPTNLRVEYFIDAPRHIIDIDTLFAVALLTSIAVIWFSVRKRNAIAFCLGWFFISLIPVYNIVPIKVMMAERFLYLPSIAFAFLVALFISAAYYRFKKNQKVTAILVSVTLLTLIMYLTTTISRNAEWVNDISLYKNEILRSPGNPLSHYLLGFAYAKEAKRAILKDEINGYYELAIAEFIETIRLDQDFQLAYLDLANAYYAIGYYEVAVKYYKKAIALGEDSGVYNNLSTAYLQSGKYDEAIAACKRALCMGSPYYYPYVNLGNAYFEKREYAKAKRAWLTAVRLGCAAPALIKQISGLSPKEEPVPLTRKDL